MLPRCIAHAVSGGKVYQVYRACAQSAGVSKSQQLGGVHSKAQ